MTRALVAIFTGLLSTLAMHACTPAARADGFPAGWYRTTAYCHVGSLTASGTVPHLGTIAAPRGVPFGTVLEIPGYPVPGVVEDRGGAIWGNRLDIWLPDCAAAWQWGVRWVEVRERVPAPETEGEAPIE